MKKEFKIDESGISLEGNGYKYDLHNDYDYKGLKLQSMDISNLKIFLNKAEGNWVKKDDPLCIIIFFKNVRFFEVSKDFFSSFLGTIEEIGFKNYNDHDYNWLMTEKQASDKSHFVFMFENSQYLRVFSESVEVHLTK